MPASLRALATEAFSAINSYSDAELHAFYGEYLAYLDRARVKWVRVGYLRRLAEAPRGSPCRWRPMRRARRPPYGRRGYTPPPPPGSL